MKKALAILLTGLTLTGMLSVGASAAQSYATTPMLALGGRGGTGFTLALRDDGTVWGWGSNWFGQLGDGTDNNYRFAPAQVPGLSNIRAVAAGGGHSVALRNDGSVWTWGQSYYGELGYGGTRTNTTKPGWVMSNVKAIAAGSYHTVALRSDGTVWTWGNNMYGQLGNSDYSARTQPSRVGYLVDVIAITAATNYTAALRGDGTVWAWGINHEGQLGDGTLQSQRTRPVQVVAPSGEAGYLTGIVAIAACDEAMYALRGDGTVWKWGGSSSTAIRPRPIEEFSGIAPVAIASGRKHIAILCSEGYVWTLGYNDNGQLGYVKVKAPYEQAGYLSNIASVAAGSNHTGAVDNDGAVWMWGRNGDGELGDGARTDRYTPVQAVGENGAGFFSLGNPATRQPPFSKTIFSTKYESTFGNWLLFLLFGFIWMWF